MDGHEEREDRGDEGEGHPIPPLLAGLITWLPLVAGELLPHVVLFCRTGREKTDSIIDLHAGNLL